MSDFEFLLSIFGLLLGFTLVEVMSGLVRTTKSLRTSGGEPANQIRVGWLTPLLALFVILDVASYWVNAWWIRDQIAVGFDTVFAGLLIAGGYYFAASMVFPDDAQAWPDLDEWFWLHRRQVLGPLLVVNAVWNLVILGGEPPRLEWFMSQSIYFGLLGAALVARRPLVVKTGLGLISILYLSFGLIEFVSRFFAKP